MWDAIKDYFLNYKKNQNEKFNIEWLDNNGHSNINEEIAKHEVISKLQDQIDPSTVNEVRHGLSPFGQHTNVLFDAKTRGGDKREILRSLYGLDNEDKRALMRRNLMEELKNNPDFADTLTSQTRDDIKSELDHSSQPFRYFLHMLGL